VDYKTLSPPAQSAKTGRIQQVNTGKIGQNRMIYREIHGQRGYTQRGKPPPKNLTLMTLI
jgi:hypothetical protein